MGNRPSFWHLLLNGQDPRVYACCYVRLSMHIFLFIGRQFRVVRILCTFGMEVRTPQRCVWTLVQGIWHTSKVKINNELTVHGLMHNVPQIPTPRELTSTCCAEFCICLCFLSLSLASSPTLQSLRRLVRRQHTPYRHFTRWLMNPYPCIQPGI